MTHPTINNIQINSENRLSVQVTLTGLSFLVTNIDSRDKLFFSEKKLDSNLSPEETLLELQKVISNNQNLQGTFKEVSLVYSTNLYTLVPESLFDENKASEYLKFNAKILANDFVAHEVIENYDIVVVYVPFININNYFFEQYGSFHYFHSTSVLLKSFLNTEKHSQEPKIYLHLQDDFFDCIIIKNGALQLCNTYSYKTPEDFIYYVLFAIEQLKLNPDTVQTLLCGAIKEEDDYYQIAYKYIRNISFLDNYNSNIKILENETPHEQFLIKNLI